MDTKKKENNSKDKKDSIIDNYCIVINREK